MTMIELFTEVRPFDKLRREVSVQNYVTNQNGRPERPEGNTWIGDAMWALMQDCWEREPANRPTIDHVITRLSAIYELRRDVLSRLC